jgi:hypothetical protein
MRGRVVEPKTKVGSALEIAKHSLNKLKVGSSGRMHKETDLLNGVCNVGTGNSKVLEGSSKAAVVRGIMKWCAIVSGEFGASINRCGQGIAMQHVGTFKNF